MISYKLPFKICISNVYLMCIIRIIYEFQLYHSWNITFHITNTLSFCSHKHSFWWCGSPWRYIWDMLRNINKKLERFHNIILLMLLMFRVVFSKLTFFVCPIQNIAAWLRKLNLPFLGIWFDSLYKHLWILVCHKLMKR